MLNAGLNVVKTCGLVVEQRNGKTLPHFHDVSHDHLAKIAAKAKHEVGHLADLTSQPTSGGAKLPHYLIPALPCSPGLTRPKSIEEWHLQSSQQPQDYSL